MGRLKIDFIERSTFDGTVWYSRSHPGSISQRREYNVDLLEQIVYDGEDCIIKIDGGRIRTYQDWEKEEYPTEEVREKVLEVMYLTQNSIKLFELATKALTTEYENRFKLRGIAENALTLLEGIVLTNKYIELERPDLFIPISHLREVIRKEVSYSERLSSKQTQMNYFNYNVHRQRLTSDIRAGAYALSSIRFSKPKEEDK